MNEQDVINDFTFKLYFHFSLRSSMKSKVQYTTIAAFTLVRSIWVINPLGRGMVFLRLLSLSSSLLGTSVSSGSSSLKKDRPLLLVHWRPLGQSSSRPHLRATMVGIPSKTLFLLHLTIFWRNGIAKAMRRFTNYQPVLSIEHESTTSMSMLKNQTRPVVPSSPFKDRYLRVRAFKELDSIPNSKESTMATSQSEQHSLEHTLTTASDNTITSM